MTRQNLIEYAQFCLTHLSAQGRLVHHYVVADLAQIEEFTDEGIQIAAENAERIALDEAFSDGWDAANARHETKLGCRAQARAGKARMAQALRAWWQQHGEEPRLLSERAG